MCNMKKRILLKTSDAIAYYGTKSALARAVGVNRQAVQQWGEYLPDDKAWYLHYITGGKINVFLLGAVNV